MEKTMIEKVIPFEVKEVAPRTLEFVGSTEDKDRQGDIILASGWRLKDYKKNPVFLWAHNYQDPPIGKTKKVWAEDGKLKFHVEFADAETYPFADTIFRLYQGGFLRASSVGFMPLESEPIEAKDDEDYFFHRPTRYLKQDLLELSGVPVPANPNALAEAKAKNLIPEVFAEQLVKEIDKELERAELWKGDPLKPYPNEHACRLRNPDDFQEGSFRRTTRKHDGKQYSVIMGRLTGEDTMTDQAFRYPKDVWKAGEAKSHCADHDGTFEAASGTEEVSTDGASEVLTSGTGEVETAENPQRKEISQDQLADELDFVGFAVEQAGLNEINRESAWDVVRIIMREAGDDIPDDIAEKIGAVLNKKNRERLHDIRRLAQEVLDSDTQEDEPEKSTSREEAAEIIASAVSGAIRQACGKIQE